MLVDRPAVPERVDELAGAVSPERVMLRLEYRRACIDCALPDRVGIVDGQVKRPRRCRPASAGEMIPMSGNSSAMASMLSPKRSSMVSTWSSGKVIRLSSTAPSTWTYQAAAASGFLVTRWTVKVLMRVMMGADA
jgi:hypothetical protein